MDRAFRWNKSLFSSFSKFFCYVLGDCGLEQVIKLLDRLKHTHTHETESTSSVDSNGKGAKKLEHYVWMVLMGAAGMQHI